MIKAIYSISLLSIGVIFASIHSLYIALFILVLLVYRVWNLPEGWAEKDLHCGNNNQSDFEIFYIMSIGFITLFLLY